MEVAGGGADFHDWEILLAPEAAGDDHLNPYYSAVDEADGFEDGAYLSDYFALDSEQRYRNGSAFSNGNPAAEEIFPESSSPDLEPPKDELSFVVVDFSAKENGCEFSDGEGSLTGIARGELGEDGGSKVERLDGALKEKRKEDGAGENGVLWSDDSSACQRSLAGSRRGELGETGGSKAERLDEGLVEESGDVGVGELDMTERTEAKEKDVNPPNESTNSREKALSIVGKGEEGKSSKDVSVWNGEKRGMVLWKLPLELLKLCPFRVKPVWYISLAAAVLGVLVLGKRLQRMKHEKRKFSLNITLDEKKASQLKVQVARLNEAFSIVRSTPVIRHQLPAGGLVPWPMLSLP